MWVLNAKRRNWEFTINMKWVVKNWGLAGYTINIISSMSYIQYDTFVYKKRKIRKKYYVKKGPNCKRRKNTCKIIMN